MQPPLNLTGRLSPWFSEPDGVWGQGEGFPFAIGTSEKGGVLESSYDPNALQPDRAETRSTTGTPPARWMNIPNSSVREARGYFWPSNAGTPPVQHTSGWSVLAHVSRLVIQSQQPPRPLVLVIGFHESATDTHIQPGYTKPFPYVASADPFGLNPPAFPAPMDAYIEEAFQTKSYDLVMAYAVMPHGARPYPMNIQRRLELVTFVTDLFANEILGVPSFQFDLVVAAGSSHGCGNAMLAPTLFPAVFHGGVGWGHPPDFVQPMFSHEFQRWTSSHLGYAGVEAFSLYDALGIAFVEKYTGGNPAALSVPARFRAQVTAGGPAHYLQRPLFLLTGDEDPTDAGEDWMTLLGLSGVHGGAEFHSLPVPNAHPSVRLFLARADKTCHGSEGDPEYANPFNPTQTTNDIRVSLYFLIEHLLGFSSLPSAVYEPGTTSVPAPLSSDAETYLRPFDGIFGEHIPTHPSTPQPSYPSHPLTPMSGWPTLLSQPMGHAGTRLGGDGDALKVYAPPGAGTSVYVGSAEGVVTRFELASAPLSGATEKHLEIKAQSPDLGYGAGALDLGDMGSGQHRVAVATTLGLHLLDAVDLHVVNSVPLPDRKEYRPRRLQLADLNGDGVMEIVFATVGGRLAVYDAGLARVAWLDEPGIMDFAIAPAGAGIPAGINVLNETYRRPIYLALQRGHIASVLMQLPTSGVQAYLLAVSSGETGTAQDLNFAGGGLMCTYAEDLRSGDRWAHRVFNLTTLDRLFSLGEIPPLEGMPSIPPPLGGIRTCVATTTSSAARFVVLREDKLFVYNAMGEKVGEKRLRSFAPASNAVSVVAANIEGSSTSEILVSTAAGRVVWFRSNELTTSGDSFPAGTTGWSLLDRSNLSVAATWAMTFGEGKLQVVDQAGIHSEVDPATGAVSVRWNYVGEFVPGAVPGPHRSLVPIGVVHGPPLSAGLPCWADPSLIPTQARIGRIAPSSAPIPLGYVSYAIGGYWLASAGGAAYAESGGGVRLWWWNDVPFPNDHDLVLGARIDGLPGNRMLQDVLSTSDPSWGSRRRLRNNMSLPGVLETGDLQSLRVGHVLGNSDPEVVLSTVGGRVILLSGGQSSPPSILRERADYGWGGIALAVGELDGDTQPEVIHGTLFSNKRWPNEQQAATLQILKGSSSSLTLANHGQEPFTYPTHVAAYPLVGIAGIAIGEVFVNPPGQEVVVTTIDGYLYVFQVSNLGTPGSSSLRLDLLCSVAQIGALGSHSSIHIADHALNGTLTAGQDGKSEIYVAGSMGLRRIDVAP